MCVCIHHKDTHRKRERRERRINLVGEERIYFRDGGEEQLLSFFSETAVGCDREER